jgi:phospholipid/cholesterol/gamma-HCH transport system substrate-binding protein
MEPKVSYSLVGAFVIVFGGILIVIVLWLVKGGPQRTYSTYYAYFRDSVSGVNENAAVKYKGVSVGRVKGVGLDPENLEQVRLTLDIADGTPIKEDTVATLAMQGLTGLAFVDLVGGSRESPPLRPSPGQEVPVIKTRRSLLMRLDEAATTLLTNLNQIASAMGDVVDEESRASFKKIVVNLAELSAALKEREDQLDQLFVNAGRTLENVGEATQKLPALVSRATDTVAALDNMAQQIARTSQSVDATLNGNQQNIQQFTNQTLSEVGVLVTELRQLTAGLQRLSRQVEQNPKSLLFGRQPPPRGPGE